MNLTYLQDLTRNSLALAYDLHNTELIELLEDAIQELERLTNTEKADT